jgi:hypothetical protein
VPYHDDKELVVQLMEEIAVLHADDILAILQELSPENRETVECLLRARADNFVPTALPRNEALYDAGKLSEWILQLLRSGSSGALTPMARQTLHDCAIAVCPRSDHAVGSAP